MKKRMRTRPALVAAPPCAACLHLQVFELLASGNREMSPLLGSMGGLRIGKDYYGLVFISFDAFKFASTSSTQFKFQVSSLQGFKN